MLSEINAMPQVAQQFLEQSPAYRLPPGVPYLGMGSSYFAPLAFKFMGIGIDPEPAAEFFNYLHAGNPLPQGVLLSQSGRSTEVLWCAQLFEKFTVITNNAQSPLCSFPHTGAVIELMAGEEKSSSSKTYINTLLALFKGFGMNVRNAVHLLAGNMVQYEQQGMAMADAVYKHMSAGQLNGLYITGSGPNIATALQAALIMSESTKLNFNGMPMAQYDHGPKETAKDSIVIQVLAKGRSYDRARRLSDTLTAAGAHVLVVEELGATENESVLHNIIPFNFMAYYLSLKLKVKETFVVGGKVTEVQPD